MNVRKRLPTRCLCVGLSFLAAGTPVPAFAQEVLPSVAVAQDVFPVVAGVLPPVASIRMHPVGRLAPPSRGDGVDIAIDEIQASSTSPGEVTQAPPVSDARAASGRLSEGVLAQGHWDGLDSFIGCATDRGVCSSS